MRTLLPWLALHAACAAPTQPPPVSPDAVAAPAPRPARDVSLELEHDGRTRRYRVHLPPGHDLHTPLPLVVVLHGGGGNGDYAARMSGFSALAERERIAVAYPDGTGFLPRRLLTWNCGGLPLYAAEKNVDDTGFLRAMVADLVRRFCIDRERVFATGMSNGGMMVHRLAREAPDVFAAIADVAGAMNFTARDSRVPIPVLMIHGRDDQHVRYDGGRPRRAVGRAGDREDASVPDAVRYYVARNGCAPQPAVTVSGAVERRRWSGGKAPVELISIDGEGHTWPGGRKGKYPGAATPTQELDATIEIWRFFAAVARR